MGAITLGLRGVSEGLGRQSVAVGVVRFVGSQAYQKFLRREEREFRKRMRKQLRRAANVVKMRASRSAAATYPAEPGGSPARLASRSVSVGSASRQRSRRGGRAARFLRTSTLARSSGAASSNADDRGRPGRRTHTARYRGLPFFEPAVRASEAEVYRILGRTFRAV